MSKELTWCPFCKTVLYKVKHPPDTYLCLSNCGKKTTKR